MDKDFGFLSRQTIINENQSQHKAKEQLTNTPGTERQMDITTEFQLQVVSGEVGIKDKIM